jgi:hypothetical protein
VLAELERKGRRMKRLIEFLIRGFESCQVPSFSDPKHQIVSSKLKDNSSLNEPQGSPFLSRVKARIFPGRHEKAREFVRN